MIGRVKILPILSPLTYNQQFVIFVRLYQLLLNNKADVLDFTIDNAKFP